MKSIVNSRPSKALRSLIRQMERIPHGLIAFVSRFSVAATFWKSGQTKIEGFSLDIVSGTAHFGWPTLSESAVYLFEEEYRLPLIPPETAAYMAAFGEHVFPALLLIGLATRLSAVGLLIMTITIQVFVYPDAYPTHGLWAAALLYIIARGPGVFSIDHIISRNDPRPAPLLS